MKTRRGDVVLVLFSNSDLRTAKRRPALLLTGEPAVDELDLVTVLLHTTSPWQTI
jgi:mRNA-degrading endonuclease toxin of MazEF toxin-antitoxin module